MPRPFDLTTFLPYRLNVLAERVSRRLAREYGRSHDLTVAEWRVLVHLARGGAVSVRDIHERVTLDKPRVSRAVGRLEGMGLVEKDRGAGDGRLVAISLTPAGRATLDEIVPAAQAVEARLLDAVTAEDLATFFRVIDRMHRVLDADPEARPRAGP